MRWSRQRSFASIRNFHVKEWKVRLEMVDRSLVNGCSRCFSFAGSSARGPRGIHPASLLGPLLAGSSPHLQIWAALAMTQKRSAPESSNLCLSQTSSLNHQSLGLLPLSFFKFLFASLTLHSMLPLFNCRNSVTAAAKSLQSCPTQ